MEEQGTASHCDGGSSTAQSGCDGGDAPFIPGPCCCQSAASLYTSEPFGCADWADHPAVHALQWGARRRRLRCKHGVGLQPVSFANFQAPGEVLAARRIAQKQVAMPYKPAHITRILPAARPPSQRRAGIIQLCSSTQGRCGWRSAPATIVTADPTSWAPCKPPGSRRDAGRPLCILPRSLRVSASLPAQRRQPPACAD